jgi:hypothetical protein
MGSKRQHGTRLPKGVISMLAMYRSTGIDRGHVKNTTTSIDGSKCRFRAGGVRITNEAATPRRSLSLKMRLPPSGLTVTVTINLNARLPLQV